jgi:hypothetical protein
VSTLLQFATYRDEDMNMTYTEATKSRDVVLAAIIEDDIRQPDVVGTTYLKWDRPDGGYVIFRAMSSGDWGTLDVRWLETDGHLNGPFAPISFDYIPRIVRDVRILLGEAPITRDQLLHIGKA